MIDDAKLAELIALCDRALPLTDWVKSDDWVLCREKDSASYRLILGSGDSEYLAASNPATVKAMAEELTGLREKFSVTECIRTDQAMFDAGVEYERNRCAGVAERYADPHTERMGFGAEIAREIRGDK